MAKTIEIKLENNDDIRRYLAAMPRDAESVLRSSVRRAVRVGHDEALIQISRRYTITPVATERNLYEIMAGGSVPYAQLVAKGRRRRVANFNISPKSNPARGWTSSKGYDVEIVHGQKSHLPPQLFWVRTKNGPVLTSYKFDDELGPRGGKVRKGYESPFTGLSTAQMLGHQDVESKVNAKIRETLEEVFAKGMERRLRKGI